MTGLSPADDSVVFREAYGLQYTMRIKTERHRFSNELALGRRESCDE